MFTVGTEIRITTEKGDLTTYVAKPVGDGPWPGVVVIHDATGMSRDLRSQTDWLANEGYVVAAPDLFYGATMLECLRTMVCDYLTWQGSISADIETVRDWLGRQDDCTDRIGVIGFCIGGGFALQLAPGKGFSPSGANCGGLPKDLESFLRGACPIIACYGVEDTSLHGAVEMLDQALTRFAVTTDGKEYPDGHYALSTERDLADMPWLVTMIGKLVDTRRHEPSALDARRRIMAFFKKHLQTDGVARMA